MKDTSTMEQGEGCGEKFTPGPWVVRDQREMTGGEYWIVTEHDELGDLSLASVRAGCDEAAEIGDNLANASLIASAPELYEALSHLTDLFVSLAPLGDDTEREIAVINARAALLKASGGKDNA